MNLIAFSFLVLGFVMYIRVVIEHRYFICTDQPLYHRRAARAAAAVKKQPRLFYSRLSERTADNIYVRNTVPENTAARPCVFRLHKSIFNMTFYAVSLNICHLSARNLI